MEHPLLQSLRNPYRNLNSQDYAKETSTKLYFHEYGFSDLSVDNLEVENMASHGTVLAKYWLECCIVV